MKIFKEILMGIIAALVFFFSMIFILSIRAYGMPNPTGQPAEANEYAEVFANMTEEDYDLLARCVMCEAGYSNTICMEGTVCVILNRVIAEKWKGNTVKDIVNARGQFVTKSKFYKVTPNVLVYTAIDSVKRHGAKVIRDELAAQGWDFGATEYDCFATKKQSMARNHIWVGLRNENGKPIKGQGHWLGIKK